MLRPLWDVPNVRFFSLQKQPRAEDLEQFPPEDTLQNLGPGFNDFGDTAAAMVHLDLILCVDTAVAHLAGALGKRVWVLLPEIGDFRWLLDREDSPWYPTMRLFRQDRLGEWDEVIARVRTALETAVRQGLSPMPSPALSEDQRFASTDFLERSEEATSNISRVAETRHGILQYVPDGGDTARSIAWYGESLQQQLETLVLLIRPDDFVLEVGSGIGAHAVPLAKMLAPVGHLFLYETRPVLRRVLEQNLAANRTTQKTTLMRRAVSGGADVSEDRETIDQLLLEKLGLLKIQEDALASDVLAGAGATLWRLRPKLFIAVSDATTLGALATQLVSFGYRCWRMETPYFNPGNFYRRDSDIFNGRTALALLALPEEFEIAVALEGCVEWMDSSGPPAGASRVPSDPTGAASTDPAGGPGRRGIMRTIRKWVR
jgi:hypothetical protein